MDSHLKSHRIQYGPPKRGSGRRYSPRLECIENFENRVIENEYIPSITSHLGTLEEASKVNPSMIDLQPEVKWFMRPYLVNFIIQIHASLKLKPETLFLCWNIIDRYCAKRIAFKQHYQLIGCTALWIAAKYEDKKSRVPSLSELRMMCSNVYEESMFKEMEVHILSTLDWTIGHCSMESVLQLCVRFADPDGKERLDKPIADYRCNSQIVSAVLAVARYFCELSLYERSFLTFSPSLVAIASFLLACSILGVDSGAKYTNRVYHIFRVSTINANRTRRFEALSKSQGSIIPPFGQLPTPVTPKKVTSRFFDDDSESTDECEAENKDSGRVFQYGPFVSGFRGLSTINEVRKLSLLLLKLALNPSDVMIEKYTPLGVTAVVKKFIVENHLRELDSKSLQVDPDSSTVSDFAFDLSNLLLNFDSSLEFVTEQAIQYINPICQSPMATKSFSSPSSSPSNISSFSSASSQTTCDYSYDEGIYKTGSPRQTCPSSSPYVDAN